jgi:guanylate kinase
MRHVVLSGPSGVGKTTIANRLIQEGICERNISCTTRPKREYEVDGYDYDFVTESTFLDMIDQGKFAEHKKIFSHYYGTPRKRIEQAKKPLLFVVDVDGMLSLKKSGVPIVSLFIAPPNLESLRQRLLSRGTNTEQEIQTRVERAAYEMEKSSLYDHLFINDDLDVCYKKVKEFILQS